MKKQLFSLFKVYLSKGGVERDDFSFEGTIPQKFPVFCKFLRTSVVCFPVTLTRNFASCTSRLSTLCKIFASDVLPPVLEISNAVDETEEIVNVARSKSCTLIGPGILIISFTHCGRCGGVHPIIFIPCLLFSSINSISFGNCDFDGVIIHLPFFFYFDPQFFKNRMYSNSRVLLGGIII